MGNVGALEHHGFRSKLVQIRRVNLPASIASDRVRSLLIRQKEDQVRFSLRGHGLSGPAVNQPWRSAAMVEPGEADSFPFEQSPHRKLLASQPLQFQCLMVRMKRFLILSVFS